MPAWVITRPFTERRRGRSAGSRHAVLSAPGAGLYDAGRYRVRNRVRPEMIRDTPVAEELLAELERLLDENLVSAAARESWTRCVTASRWHGDTEISGY